MVYVEDDRDDLVAHMLQDPRVQASVNMQNFAGNTALHLACWHNLAVIQPLLQASADLTLTNARGSSPLSVLQRHNPTHPTTLALLAQNLDAEKAAFLVKVRRLVMASTSTPLPSFLRERVER